ncbi:MAG TPA: hypothetical protein VMF32_10660 [Xanthobacteraceae bacterium]|nr:hypothetical protein [Xanthobacteraceae bacterium]
MTAITATFALFISVLALLVSSFAAFINAEKLRLDLYNRRFEVYTKTIRLFHALLNLEQSYKDGSFAELRDTFIISWRESQFLFDRTSGIFELLAQLDDALFHITGFKEHGQSLFNSGDPETFTRASNQATRSMSLWNGSAERLEKAMSPYLNFHYTSVLSSLLYRIRH